VFIALIVGGLAYAGDVLVTLPQLRVHAIAVQSDGFAVRERDVLAAAKIDRRANVWLLNTAQIARRIEAIPYVDRAVVRRTPPADLSISVTEREPSACVRSGTHTVTIDAEARILQDACARPGAIHIVLNAGELGAPGEYAQAPQLRTLLADGRALGAARVAVRLLRQDAFGQLVAIDPRGIRLLFGSDGDLAEKARLIGPVLAATQAGRAIRAIDLRAPATPTVEFR